MINWKRIEPGEYRSDDDRFIILKTWNRVCGDHWQLRDADEPDYYKGLYHERTLLDCKLKAEAIANEKRKRKEDA